MSKFKRWAVMLTAMLLVGLGLPFAASSTAVAHQGNIKVTGTQCVSGTSMNATYRVGWDNVPKDVTGELYYKLGLLSGGGSWEKVKNVSGQSGTETFTLTHNRSAFSGSGDKNGPWVSFKIIFSNNHVVDGDTRVEGFDWSKCIPAEPKPETDTQKKKSCDLADFGFPGEAGRVERDGTAKYEWNGSEWVLGEWKWGEWELYPYSAEDYFKNCAPDKPKDKVTKTEWEEPELSCKVTSGQATRTVTTISPVWDEIARQWVDGDPVTKTESKTVSLSEEELAACQAPEPTPVVTIQSECGPDGARFITISTETRFLASVDINGEPFLEGDYLDPAEPISWAVDPADEYRVLIRWDGGTIRETIPGGNCTTPEPPKPADPTVTATAKVCTPMGQAEGTVKVTVTNTADDTKATVEYTVTLGGVDKTVTVKDGKSDTVEFTGLAAGDYPVKVVGDDGTTAETSVTVKDCPPTPVVPQAPTKVDRCEPEGDVVVDGVNIPESTDGTYTLNGTLALAGFNPVAGTSAHVVFVPNQGNVVKEGATSEWTFQFTKEACPPEPPAPVKVTVTAPAFTAPTCTAPGTVSAPDTEFYVWSISGPDSAKVYTAVVREGLDHVTLVGQTSWTFDLTKKTGEECAPEPEKPGKDDKSRGKGSKTDPVATTLHPVVAASLAGLAGLIVAGAAMAVGRRREV